jgi:type IV pilus assembly protein PilB
LARKNVLLGDFLLEQKIITEEELRRGLKYHKETGKLLGRCLIELGIIDEKSLIKSLSDQMGVQYVSLKNYSVDPTVLQLVPRDFALAHRVFPLFKIENKLTVGMVNPLDIIATDRLANLTGLQVEPVVCHEQDIEDAIYLHYKGSDSFKEAEQHFSVDEEEKIEEEDESRLRTQAGEGPVIKLVNMILLQAIKDGASDIHVEPKEKSLSIRYRIDGVLHEVLSPPKNMQLPIVSRLKILSNMNIAERRLPQDGRFRWKKDRRFVDFRVSTLPTAHGENTVLRLLDNSSTVVQFEDQGMSGSMIEEFCQILHRAYGIILVTGPTGSGKSTTLYAALHEIESPDRNIMTLEDPIEYNMDSIRQSQVNPKIGMTFASGLRSILRQDPDVIMVGEIRDLETAEIAIKSALTGHLVLSTLHTNDASGAIIRLVDMGVEPFLGASAIQGVLAQRLVRSICKHCVKEYQPDPKMVEVIAGAQNGNGKKEFMRGEGCDRCKGTGYKGRRGIYELFTMDDNLRQMVIDRKSSTAISAAAKKAGMRSMIMDGLQKVEEGTTTIEEVFRVTQV